MFLEPSQLVQAMANYRDSFALITQKDKDGGDTANRTGAYYIYLKALQEPLDDLNQNLDEGLSDDLRMLTKRPGRYMRHIDESRWYSNENNFTRDQSIVIQSALVMYERPGLMWSLIKERAKRGFFHFNSETGDDRPETQFATWPDPPSPVEFGQFIRGLNLWFLRPLLEFTDMQLIFDVLVTLPFLVRRDDVPDFDVQYLPILVSSLHKYPSLSAQIAKLLYKQTNACARLRHYFRETEGRNGLYPLGELACKTFNQL